MQMAQESAENLFQGSLLKGMPSKRDGFDWSFVSATLPKTNSSSMKIGWNPKRKGSSSNSQFSGALAVSFREGKSGKSWKTWGKQVASCETTSVSSSDMVISSSWSRELKITSIKLPLKTSAQRWWDRWDCWDTTCRSQGRWQFGRSGNFPVTSYPPIPMAPSLVSPPCVGIAHWWLSHTQKFASNSLRSCFQTMQCRLKGVFYGKCIYDSPHVFFA